MRYVLDFDRVLFDTDAFIARLAETGLGSIPRGQQLLDVLDDKKIKLDEFVHPGVFEFLRTNGNDSAIVSSYISRNRLDNDTEESEMALFQKKKIELSGVAGLVAAVKITGKNKDVDLSSFYEKGSILLDDEPEHIELGKTLGYRTVWYRTTKNVDKTCDQADHEVDTFADFVKLERTWNKRKTIYW